MSYKITRLDNGNVEICRTYSEALNRIGVLANYHYAIFKKKIRFRIEEVK